MMHKLFMKELKTYLVHIVFFSADKVFSADCMKYYLGNCCFSLILFRYYKKKKNKTLIFVAYWFEQLTYVCEENSNFQDLKSIFTISHFKIFPIILLMQLSFGVFLV